MLTSIHIEKYRALNKIAVSEIVLLGSCHHRFCPCWCCWMSVS